MVDFYESESNLNNKVRLSGDSIWMDNGGSITFVEATKISLRVGDEEDPSNNHVQVFVHHNGPWEIYTDTGFERRISSLIGYDVTFSEQGMQEDGKAHLDGWIQP